MSLAQLVEQSYHLRDMSNIGSIPIRRLIKYVPK